MTYFLSLAVAFSGSCSGGFLATSRMGNPLVTVARRRARPVATMVFRDGIIPVA